MQLPLSSKRSDDFQSEWRLKLEQIQTLSDELRAHVEKILEGFATYEELQKVFNDVDEIIKSIETFWCERQMMIRDLHREAFIKRRNQFKKETLSCSLNSKFCELLKQLPRQLTRSELLPKLDKSLVEKRLQCVNNIFALLRKFLSSCLDFTILPDRVFPRQSSPSCYNIGNMEVAYNLDFDDSFKFKQGPDTWKVCFYFFESNDENLNCLRSHSYRENECFEEGIIVKGVNINEAAKKKKKEASGSSHDNRPTNSLYLKFDSECGKFKHEDDARIDDSENLSNFLSDGRLKKGKRKFDKEDIVAKRFHHFVVSVEIPVKDMKYGGTDEYIHQFGNVKAYVIAPESRAMTHTKQGGIDADGYLLFLSAFGSLDHQVTVEDIVQQMFIPRYEAILEISFILSSDLFEKVPLTGVCDMQKRSMTQSLRNTLNLAHANQTKKLFSSDDLMKIMVKDSEKDSRPWNWFMEICNNIQLYNCHRDNCKTRKVIELENLALLILNGYITPFITREEAENILWYHDHNTFLLRMSASAFECKVLLSLRVTEEVQREKNFTTPFAHAHIAFETSQSSPIVAKIVKKLKAEKLRVPSLVLRRVCYPDNLIGWQVEPCETLNRFCKKMEIKEEDTYHQNEIYLPSLLAPPSTSFPRSPESMMSASESVRSDSYMPNDPNLDIPRQCVLIQTEYHGQPSTVSVDLSPILSANMAEQQRAELQNFDNILLDSVVDGGDSDMNLQALQDSLSESPLESVNQDHLLPIETAFLPSLSPANM